MSVECAPCPFCGSRLSPIRNQGRDKIIAFQHPSGDCFLYDRTIGIEWIERFNRRALAMTLATDHGGRQYPVFNLEGNGTPIGIKMINDTVEYYRKGGL